MISSTVPAKTPRQFIQAMIWMLENIGWCQAAFFRDAKGNQIAFSDVIVKNVVPASMCVVGAMSLVVADNPNLRSKMYSLSIGSSFNDTPGRTKEEVIAALQKEMLKYPE